MNGLTTAEVEEKRKQFGANTIEFKEDRNTEAVMQSLL